jgi:uncharacterized protein
MTSQIDTAAQNTQMVKSLYSAFGRRDIPTILAMLSPDVVWKEPENPYNPAGGTRRGISGFLEWAQIGNQSEEILVLEPRQFIAQGDSVAVVGYTKIRVRTTQKVYESDWVHLATIKDGKIVSFQEFFDTFAAGEAFRK